MLQRHFKIQVRKKVGLGTHLFFMAFLFVPATLDAQRLSAHPTDKKIEAAYYTILKLKLNEGREVLKKSSPSQTDLAIKVYAENLADILELLITEDKELYHKKAPLEKERVKILQAISDSNPYKNFCEAEIKLQWAFVKLKFGDELSAVWNFKQAYSIIAQHEKAYPDFLANRKTLGVLNVIFGAVPEKYQWVLDILGLGGNTGKGNRQLKELANSDDIFAMEGKILLNLVKAYLLESAANAAPAFQALASNNPDNKLIRYLLALVLIKSGDGEAGMSTLSALDTLSHGYLPLTMKYYLRGEISLQNGSYASAIKNYKTFIDQYTGDNFVKDSYYKLFLCHWLNGDTKKADFFFDKAREEGSTTAEADKYAERQLSLGIYPEPVLMKIRLATDGGYYDLADALVRKNEGITFELPQENLEFIYRKARLSHKQEKLEEAIAGYEKTIEMSGENSNFYFAPNAALQLGYIFLSEKNMQKARHYFLKVLSYEGHEYKNSLDHKAKVALEKINLKNR